MHDTLARGGEPAQLTVTASDEPARDEADPIVILDAIEAAHPGHPVLQAPIRDLMEFGVEVQESCRPSRAL